MKIDSDWHLHTTHSYDCGLGKGKPVPGLDMATLTEKLGQKGIRKFGITDHVHCPYNLVDIFESEKEFRALPFNPDAHFGVETSCISKWELEEMESGRLPASATGIREGGPAGGELALGVSAEDVKNYGFEYVIGAVHWPMYVELTRENVIKDYHRQLMFLATHELVDIVGHPWWWGGAAWRNEEGKCVTDPWLDDFGKIPLSMHDEFAAALKENGKVAEANIHSCLFSKFYPEDFSRQYADYIAYLTERGVKISVGSDSHGGEYEPDLEHSALVLEDAGLSEKDFWELPPREEPTAKTKPEK